MKSGKIGYVRVSTVDQNTGRQLADMELDKVFTDKVSGKDVNRPELTALLEWIREGDEVFVHSMDRLARNLKDLLELVKQINAKGATITFVKEGQTFTGEDSPMQNMILGIMGSVAEFERAIILERQREGVAIAVEEGKYKGKKKTLDADQVTELKRRVAAGHKKTDIARDYGITSRSVYNYIKAA